VANITILLLKAFYVNQRGNFLYNEATSRETSGRDHLMYIMRWSHERRSRCAW